MHYFTHVSKQDQKSIRYDRILQWLQMAYGISLTYLITCLLSYHKSRDAIASKNTKTSLQDGNVIEYKVVHPNPYL